MILSRTLNFGRLNGLLLLFWKEYVWGFVYWEINVWKLHRKRLNLRSLLQKLRFKNFFIIFHLGKRIFTHKTSGYFLDHCPWNFYLKLFHLLIWIRIVSNNCLNSAFECVNYLVTLVILSGWQDTSFAQDISLGDGW